MKYSTLTLLSLFLLVGATHSGYAMEDNAIIINVEQEAIPLQGEETQDPPTEEAQLLDPIIEENQENIMANPDDQKCCSQEEYAYTAVAGLIAVGVVLFFVNVMR